MGVSEHMDYMYIHSKCCNSHWELVYDVINNTYALRCEKCERSAGPDITITGPNLAGCKCEHCKKEESKETANGTGDKW